MTRSFMLGTALWLGLLTSVSPCPLAANLAATAFLCRRVDSRKRAVVVALAYTGGRIVSYVAIACLLAAGLASAPGISHGFQRWMTPLLGPLLVVTSMILLGILSPPWFSSITSQAGAERWATRGYSGGFVLGCLFALSFCPVSAALFFGSLMPLTLRGGEILWPVTCYGIGTAMPVAGIALLMICSVRSASRLAGGIARLQPWILKATGILLLAAGLYLTARDTLEVLN